ncbi:hypothetical protein ACLKA6_005667, partial [Drosophila palustris]
MSGTIRFVQLPFAVALHLSCHFVIVASLLEVGSPLHLASSAKRSNGIIPAKTSAASSETVRNALNTLSAQ